MKESISHSKILLITADYLHIMTWLRSTSILNMSVWKRVFKFPTIVYFFTLSMLRDRTFISQFSNNQILLRKLQSLGIKKEKVICTQKWDWRQKNEKGRLKIHVCNQNLLINTTALYMFDKNFLYNITRYILITPFIKI